MTTPPFTITYVPLPASPEHISAYTKMRLTALSSDPDSFGTSFARTSAGTPEVWRERMNKHKRTTLVAIHKADEGDGEEEWIGTLSVLWPEKLLCDPEGRNSASYPQPIREAQDQGLIDVYMLVGMWVHPEYRGKGVGHALIERALHDVKAGPTGAVDEEKKKKKKKVVLLEVYRHNEAAQKLYKKAGFTRQERGPKDRDDVDWMATTID